MILWWFHKSTVSGKISPLSGNSTMGEKSMPSAQIYGPTERPDSAPPHENPIRRFREELRLTRQEFAELIEENVESLRVWETSGMSKPRPDRAIKIIAIAKRNNYPLELEDIYPGAQ